MSEETKRCRREAIQVTPERPPFRSSEIPLFPIIRWLQRQLTGRTARCPQCDEAIRPTARVCHHCGRSLVE
jgi:hypothetical protein